MHADQPSFCNDAHPPLTLRCMMLPSFLPFFFLSFALAVSPKVVRLQTTDVVYERIAEGRGHELVLDEVNIVTGPVSCTCERTHQVTAHHAPPASLPLLGQSCVRLHRHGSEAPCV